MKELTFCGFLTKYVKELSYCDSLSIHKLALEARVKNARLYEPLFLYVLFTEKMPILLSATRNDAIKAEFIKLSNKYNKTEMLKVLELENSDLPREYNKVYKSYLVVKNRNKNDSHTKELMRNKILKLKEQKHVSNYRIYTDLNLNAGNVNAFLKSGDKRKISLDIARQTIAYLEKL